ncbi:MAG: ABC transporter ATP-binding protein [Betaproteobacteria bacterium]
MLNQTLLKAERLAAGYGAAKVLHDVSLEVGQGEIVCLVGRNGAGKTTLLRTISGFLHPTSGSLVFDGQAVERRVRPETMARRGVRYVSQDKRVFSRLTVRENIELAAFASGEPKGSAVEKVVGMCPWVPRFLDSKAAGLSGGQRQLLLIARALLGQPRLILLDEPTEGLAAGVIEDIARLLAGLKGEISLIIVEQNLSLVERLADRVYLMQEGHCWLHHREGDCWSRAELEAAL